MPASDVLSNHQIDDWCASEEPEEEITDEDEFGEGWRTSYRLIRSLPKLIGNLKTLNDAAGDVMEFEDK